MQVRGWWRGKGEVREGMRDAEGGRGPPFKRGSRGTHGSHSDEQDRHRSGRSTTQERPPGCTESATGRPPGARRGAPPLPCNVKDTGGRRQHIVHARPVASRSENRGGPVDAQEHTTLDDSLRVFACVFHSMSARQSHPTTKSSTAGRDQPESRPHCQIVVIVRRRERQLRRASSEPSWTLCGDVHPGPNLALISP